MRRHDLSLLFLPGGRRVTPGMFQVDPLSLASQTHDKNSSDCSGWIILEKCEKPVKNKLIGCSYSSFTIRLKGSYCAAVVVQLLDDSRATGGGTYSFRLTTEWGHFTELQVVQVLFIWQSTDLTVGLSVHARWPVWKLWHQRWWRNSQRVERIFKTDTDLAAHLVSAQ